MTLFAAKASPTEEKLRGGYYTPDPIAAYIARWVGEAGERLLEPSCGDGAVLRHLVQQRHSEVQGVELLGSEAEKAVAATAGKANIHVGDFFHWFSSEEHGRWDGAAGNPPYIRFGHWPEEDRVAAFDLMSDVGLKPTRLTNAWVPFVVASVLAVRDGGRIALVLPAELMQVTYAAQLRDFLLSRLNALNLVSFRKLVFPGILQEVVLLLGVRGQGPPSIQTAEVDDETHLEEIDWSRTPAAPALRHEREKWTKYFLSPAEIEVIRWARESGGLVPLSCHAGVDVGVVTGRNSFFTMKPSEASSRMISEFCTPLVARSAQLSGIRYSRSDLKRDYDDDARCLLLTVNGEGADPKYDSLRSYLDAGEDAAVHEGYKCRIRKQWWSVPSVWAPDAFMLRQIHRHPMAFANETAATSTDTVHRLRMRSSTSATQLAAAMLNSATFAFAEVLGRSYGGGILELEPREAEELLIPCPEAIPDGLTAELDRLLRNGDREAAVDLGDEEFLRGQCGWSADQVDLVRSAWTRLRDRRAHRGRSSR